MTDGIEIGKWVRSAKGMFNIPVYGKVLDIDKEYIFIKELERDYSNIVKYTGKTLKVQRKLSAIVCNPKFRRI